MSDWTRLLRYLFGRCTYRHREAVGGTLWTDARNELLRCERWSGHRGEHVITLRTYL